MLDPVVHFPQDCEDTEPCSTPATGHHGINAECIAPGVHDLETSARNLATEFMDAAGGNTFLLKHLLADFHIFRGKQQTLLAQMKHGLVEPSQVELHFSPIEDGCNMSLKRRKDFLERQR
jgi:hypothetical protein